MKNIQILYPLNYLLLQNEQGKYVILLRDLKYVVSITSILSFFFVFMNIDLFSDKGLINNLEGLSINLTSIYILSLIFIAIFNRENLSIDKKIPDNLGAIYLKFSSGKKIQLTRRQYVCLIFGYLSFQAIIFSIGSLIAVHSSSNIVNYLHYYNMDILIHLKILVVFLLLAMFSHMIITTFLGIYYLSYRIYDKEPKIIGYDVKEDV